MTDLQKLSDRQTIVQLSRKSHFSARIVSPPWPQLVQQMPSAWYYSTSIALYEPCEMEAGAPQGNEIRASEYPWAIQRLKAAQISNVP